MGPGRREGDREGQDDGVRGGMLCLGEVGGLLVVSWWVGTGRWGRGLANSRQNSGGRAEPEGAPVSPFTMSKTVSWHPSPILQVSQLVVHSRGSDDTFLRASSFPLLHSRA